MVISSHYRGVVEIGVRAALRGKKSSWLKLTPQDFLKATQEICDRSQNKSQISCLLHLCCNYRAHNFLAEESVVQYYNSFSGLLLLQFTALVAAICYAVAVPPCVSFFFVFCGICMWQWTLLFSIWQIKLNKGRYYKLTREYL